MPIHIPQAGLPKVGNSGQFEGVQFDPAVPLAIFFTELAPGQVIEPHTHTYAEVFVILAGLATYEVAGERIQVAAGDVVVALPDEAHAILATGDTPLRQLGIHCNGEFVTTWLTDV